MSQEVAERVLAPFRSSGQQYRKGPHASTLEDATVRVIADGSGDLAESYRRAVLRAADGDDATPLASP